MITIQDLQKYFILSEKGLAEPILCPMNNLDGPMVPWVDKEKEAEEPCMWCLACNVKKYLSLKDKESIMKLLHQ